MTTAVTQQRNDSACKSVTSSSQTPSNSPIHWVISEETSPIFRSAPLSSQDSTEEEIGKSGRNTAPLTIQRDSNL